jgi:sterol desaturase/sphingolipid hydroxylase (fatty acid hydroxylase superfamily)
MMPNAVAAQIGIYALIITSILIAEHFLSASSAGKKLKHFSMNSLFVPVVLLVQIPMSISCLAIATWSASVDSGLIYLLPRSDNPWIKFALMFLVLDFLDYLYHFTMHRVPLFWRFHLVHHSDLAVDVSTTFREHPGETLLRNTYLIMWVFILGASPEILLLRQTTQSLFNLLSHASFRFPWPTARILGWLFITPNLHHIHHHFQLPYTNSNYGDVFSIWDRLFGTLSVMAEKTPTYGLDGHMAYVAKASFLQTLSMPFLHGMGRDAPAAHAECRGVGPPMAAVASRSAVFGASTTLTKRHHRAVKNAALERPVST